METLLAAYAVAWAMVTAYVMWIAVGNRRLAGRLERLESVLSQHQSNTTARTKVA